MTKPVEIHVEQVVLHGRTDAAAVERSIVDHVTRALEERGLDPDLATARGTHSLGAIADGASAGAVGRGVASSLTGGGRS